jgi:hypothetical protein
VSVPKLITDNPGERRARVLFLDDVQMMQVMSAVELLPPSNRDAFLRSVSNMLTNTHQPSNHEVNSAIEFCLNAQGVAARFEADDVAPSKIAPHDRPRRRH